MSNSLAVIISLQVIIYIYFAYVSGYLMYDKFMHYDYHKLDAYLGEKNK